jgi:hypothetical protein
MITTSCGLIGLLIGTIGSSVVAAPGHQLRHRRLVEADRLGFASVSRSPREMRSFSENTTQRQYKNALERQ